MKKRILIALLILSVVSVIALIFSRFKTSPLICNPLETICFNDDETINYNEQSLVIAVETQNQKDYLSSVLQPVLENTTGTVSIIVRESTSAFTFMNSPIDIALVDKQAAGSLYPYLHRFDLEEVNPYFIDYASKHLDEINYDGVAFIPATIDGPFFVMNTTLLSRLGYDINDVDEHGRLNALNSFEEIMSEGDRLRSNRPMVGARRLTSLFPLTLVEPWSLYSFLTPNGWNMYPTNDAYDHGLDAPLFKEALELFEPLLSYEWDLTGQNQTQWRYESELVSGTAPFAIKVPFLNLEAISSVTRQNYVVTPMPTMDGRQPYTLAQVKGWVFKSTASPALRQLVMQELTSYNFTQLLLLEDREAVMIDPSRVNEFKVSEFQKQKILAAQFTLSPPLFALPHFPSVLGFDFYTQGELLPIFEDLQTQTLTPAQAQEAILKAYDRWVIERTYYETQPNP